MSETMPNPTDWLQIYQHTLSEQPQTPPPSTTVFGGSQLSDATVVTTTTSSASLHHHGPLGRGSRTIRRRSRASRRTPTTVFNTNTTNFRAMVQQFTGSHSEPFSFSGLEPDTFGSRNINLHHQQIVNPSTTPSAYNIQFQQEVQQIFPYTNPPSQDHTIGHEAFFHRLGNSSSRSNMEVSENLIMDDRTLFPPQHQRGQE